ncbi:hypothetical protein KP509_33G013900 [Ceratopteris richardii]|uniref:Uncharacterized protein n=1 Tax=Ceratopteris richardii TaxID=49495 RepID=A0A8T2QM75_CERRI|nr:hypothetical protein KP509_33G013900 [Ceratopteris richardii]
MSAHAKRKESHSLVILHELGDFRVVSEARNSSEQSQMSSEPAWQCFWKTPSSFSSVHRKSIQAFIQRRLLFHAQMASLKLRTTPLFSIRSPYLPRVLCVPRNSQSTTPLVPSLSLYCTLPPPPIAGEGEDLHFPLAKTPRPNKRDTPLHDLDLPCFLAIPHYAKNKKKTPPQTVGPPFRSSHTESTEITKG